jgi:hypothetical protein
VNKSRAISIDNKAQANIKDTKIQKFPTCSVPNDHQCRIQVNPMWQGGKNNVLIDGAAALVHQSTVQCLMCGGVIRVLKDNQTLETDGATEAPKNDQATKKKEETRNSVLDQITQEVNKKVNSLTRSSKAKFVDLPVPFNALGYHYGELHGSFRSSWGKPDFVAKMMVIALYWNYLHSNSEIKFNDFSLPNGGDFIVNGSWMHQTHKTGDDADLYIIWNGTKNLTNINVPNGYNLKNPLYVSTGRAKIIEFINTIKLLYPNQFHEIIWCDEHITGLYPPVYTNFSLRVLHSTHIHVGY